MNSAELAANEFKHQLEIEPRNPARKLEAKALQDSGACPDAQMQLARALKFEAQLDDALEIAMPQELQAQLLAIAGVSEAAPQQIGVSRRRWLSLAAGVAIVGIGAMTAYQFTRPTPRNAQLVQHCADHMMHEPFAILRQEVVPKALVERLFAANGFATTNADGSKLVDTIGNVNYLAPCTVDGKSAIHLVVQTEAGPVTVLVLNQQATDGASDSRVGPAMIRVSPLNTGSAKPAAMILVAESGVSVDRVEARFLQALNS